MLNWLRQLFNHEPNPYIGAFTDWECDKYTAWDSDNIYSVWIANGFFAFSDYSPSGRKKTLLVGLSKSDRRLVYDALIHDLGEKSKTRLKHLKELAGEDTSN